MSIKDVFCSLIEEYSASHDNRESSVTFLLLGNDDHYKGALATRLVGKKIIIPKDASRYLALFISPDDTSVEDTNASCFILGSSSLFKSKLREFDLSIEPKHLHIVLLVSAACLSGLVMETKTWLDAIYDFSRLQHFSSCTILLTNGDSLQNMNSVCRKIILRCIRALALVANNRLFTSVDSSSQASRTTIYTVSSTDDVVAIAEYLLKSDQDISSSFDLVINEDEAILHIPPGMDSHTMICQSSSPDEALKLQMDIFKTNVQDEDGDSREKEEVTNIQEYFNLVTAKTKAEDPILSDILANLEATYASIGVK